jgi:GNAT superfamily N-acetyltransferase
VKTGGCEIVHADSAEYVETIRALFREYADGLGFSLCFQGFDEELSGLPGNYSRPRGRILLARINEGDVGCIAMQPLSADVCEMKRLYVRPAFRGSGIGRFLADAIIREASGAGYRAMRLDTIEPLMPRAIALYRRFGFREIPAYRPNPIPGALYMELRLSGEQVRQRWL